MTAITGTVQNPTTVSSTDNVENSIALGKQNQQLVDLIHGKYWTSSVRGALFSANVTAKTVPVIAATLVSVFTLWNPASSRVNVELVTLDMGLVLATTVVDTVGLYWQNGASVTSGTFTTVGVKGTNWFCAKPSQPIGQAQFYSAFTHSGTPVRIRAVGQFGATTSTNDTPITYNFDGTVILEPGDLISVAMSTAASTASGVDLGLTYAEVPL